MNVGMSDGFSKVDHEHLPFPSIFYIDYVRLYQPPHEHQVGCSPQNMPTQDYIERYKKAYDVWNYTSWDGPGRGSAGYPWPTAVMPRQCPDDNV